MKNLKNLFLGYLLLVISFGYSQQPHSGGIVVPTGFKITANQPVDDRTVVTSVEDLDTLPNKYAGLICYVEDNQGLYIYNGTEWLDINSGSELVDSFINLSDITVVDNDVTVSSGLEWRINGIEYELTSNWTDTIPFATEGFTRKDIIVATNTGTLLRIAGDEDEDNAVQPLTPTGTLLLTVIDVYGDFLGTPSEPEPAYGRIKKVGEKWRTSYVQAGGVSNMFLLESNGRNVGVYVYDTGGDFEYGTLGGMIADQPLQEYPVDNLLWDGCIVRIQHLPTTANKNLRIEHNRDIGTGTGVGVPFWFPNEEDYYYVEPYEILTFIYKKSFTVASTNGAFIYLGSNMSSGGGVTGDFIPLSGTEVGKPLTGGIEISNDGGFYSVDGDSGRAIGMSSDNIVIENFNSDFGKNSFFVLNTDYNQIGSENLNENSNLNQTPQNTTITTTDADGNKAEIVVGDYGTVRFNSDMPDDNWVRYMFYNAEEGLQLREDNSNERSGLQFHGINGHHNTKNWEIRKYFYDSNDSNLLLPDSGTTQRRIPVSVNGNYANQQGDIELELTADNIDYDNTASGLLAETVQEALDEIAEDYVPTSEVTSIATPDKVVQYSNTGNVNTSLAEFPENAVPLFQLNAMLDDYIQEPTTDGTSGQVLTTDGSGGRSWTTPTDLSAYLKNNSEQNVGGGFSLSNMRVHNSTSRTVTITKAEYDGNNSELVAPMTGDSKVIPISVNGNTAGPTGNIIIPLGIEVDKFIGVSLGGSNPSENINFAASNPNIVNYEEIEIGIQFLGKPTTTTDFYITFNSNTNPIYNSTTVDNSGTTTSFTNQNGFRFKYDSNNGFYTFKVKNNPQTGIPRIITGSGVEFGDNTTEPKTWTFGGGLHSNENITTLQIKSVDGTTNVPNMRVSIKKTF